MEKAAMPDALDTITGPLFMAAHAARFPGHVQKANILRIAFRAATDPTAAMLIFPHDLAATDAGPCFS